ncbi:hypothetical protein SSPO_023760 [Streptomyces antimycoticus]|uniref:Uncharacterized protein n=1 Tax=Streptomyces antimycoticus TaxID=68175 RepID=A0A499UJ73_9ACTN|nr:hypothetical protein [Streptomyces antimycoticus]BBJ39658.1 hypothetical protein SSPO_023760 [Streptomyces antimycoticus]
MLTDTICAALSAAGLGIAGVTAYRKRFLAATRIAAYALVPLGLAMTGILDWVADLVFKPTVWLGFGVLGLSWVLFMISRAVERRSGGTRKERKAAAAAERAGVSAGASEPALGPGRAAAGAKAGERPKAKGGTSSGTDDFSDIEAILKKHGI